MNTLSKIIYYLVVGALVFISIKEFFVQRDMEITATDEVFGWYFAFGNYGNILISFASVLSFILYRKFFPGYVSVCYICLILCIVITSFNDLGEVVKQPSFFYSIKGIGTFINIGLLFFVANTKYVNKILKFFYYICFFFIIAGLINLSKVGIGATRTQNQYAVLNFAVYLIWVFPYFFLQEEFNKRVNLINFLTFLTIFLFVLGTGSRSYIIIYLSYFFVKFKSQLQKKNSILIILGMGLLIIGAFFILANSGLNKTIEGFFTILSERSTEDSRSSQLVEFIDQFDLDKLWEGAGPKATWFWSVVGPYPFLDNQFLLLVWWAGLPAFLLYLFLLVVSFLKKSEILFFENIKGARMMLGWWILGCMGFAIYITISSTLYYYFITLLMGQQYCQFKKIIIPTELEED